MSDEDKNFEKMFSEIISSDQLKDISETFDEKINLDIKEILLIQQSLLDSISHINDILLSLNNDKNHDIFNQNNECYDILCSMYKISEDFNDSMIEYYVDSETDAEDNYNDEGDI